MKDKLEKLEKASKYFHEKAINHEAILSCRNTDEYFQFIKSELEHFKTAEKVINKSIERLKTKY